MTGTITIYFFTRGYGFLAPDDGDRDLFFHVRDLPDEYSQRAIAKGTRVGFEIAMRDGKPIARNIVVLGGAE